MSTLWVGGLYALYNVVLAVSLKNRSTRLIMAVTAAHFLVGGLLWAMGLSTIQDRYEELKTFRGITLALVDLFILISFLMATKAGNNDNVLFGISWAMALFSNLVCMVDQFTKKDFHISGPKQLLAQFLPAATPPTLSSRGRAS